MKKEDIKKMFTDTGWMARMCLKKDEDRGLLFGIKGTEDYIIVFENKVFDETGEIVGKNRNGDWCSVPASRLYERSCLSYKDYCFNEGRIPKLRNKDIKKMFASKDFMGKHSYKGCEMWGRCLIFDVPNSGLKHVEVYEKRIFNENGNIICNCNGYWYSLKASELMWCGTTEEEHDEHCMILEGFVSGHSFKRFSD